MTATEELRAMLDERGVEWKAGDTHRLFVTSWKDADGHSWTFVEHRDGSFCKLTTYHITPAQAVEATLGRGECQLVKATWDEGSIEHGLECTGCGYRSTFASEYWNYCPDCGRKVML